MSVFGPKIALRITSEEYAEISQWISDAMLSGSSDAFDQLVADKFGDRCPDIRRAVEERRRIDIELVVVDVDAL